MENEEDKMKEGVVGRREARKTDDDITQESQPKEAVALESVEEVLKAQQDEIDKNLSKIQSVKLRLGQLNNAFERLQKIHAGYERQSNKLFQDYAANIDLEIAQMRETLISLSTWTIKEAQGRVLTTSLQAQIHLTGFIKELETHFLSRPPL